MQGSILLINIPPKVSRPKQENRYIPVDNLDDIKDGVFDYRQYGKAVFRPAKHWKNRERNDIIEYSEEKDKMEFEKNIRIGKYFSSEHKSIIHGIVKKYWHGNQSLTMNFQSTQAQQNLCVAENQDTAHMNPG